MKKIRRGDVVVFNSCGYLNNPREGYLGIITEVGKGKPSINYYKGRLPLGICSVLVGRIYGSEVSEVCTSIKSFEVIDQNLGG